MNTTSGICHPIHMIVWCTGLDQILILSIVYVSGSHVPIIRRINCINTTSGICHSIQTTIWCAGLDETLIQTCTPNGHLYRATYTRCHIDTINSPDDGHVAARNMYRIEINIHKKRTVRQVGYLRRLYRDTRSTEQPISRTPAFRTVLVPVSLLSCITQPHTVHSSTIQMKVVLGTCLPNYTAPHSEKQLPSYSLLG